jgi:hypothetical protein
MRRRPRARGAQGGFDVTELVPGFEPASSLEITLAFQPALLAGLAWGKPRPAHPEGPVGLHVSELLEQIDLRGETRDRRTALRVIALVHDSFKYRVVKWLPRTGENHHAMRARRFLEGFSTDERLLTTVELHDRPYHTWKRLNRTGTYDEARFEQMLARIPDHDLFLTFVEIDGASEAKNPQPIRWYRDQLRKRDLVQ